MKTTVKEVFESDNWIITKIIQGLRKNVLIDAKTRFHQADVKNFFSGWCSEKYADKLAKDKYGKKTKELNAYKF